MTYRLSRPSLLCLLALLAAPTLLLWRVIFMGDVFLPAALLRDLLPWRDSARLVPWNALMWDGMAEFYPWRLFAARTLHQGYLPLWNPYQFCGTPFLANIQSAVFYPPNLLFALLPVARAFGVSVWLHLALTGIFCYKFLRSGAVGTGRIAAVTGSIIWQISTWQVGWLALPTFLCVSAWLPLCVWLVWRLVERPSAGRAATLGAVLGLTVLAGHLQIALYGFLLTSAYALFLLARAVRLKQTRLVPLLGWFALALVVMAGLSLPQMLPTLELSRVSHRAGIVPTAANYGAYVKLALPWPNLVTLYLPGIFGNPTEGTFWGIGTNGGPGAYVENGCSVGILGLLFALAGVAAGWRTQSGARFFAVAAGLALLLALGTPLNALLYFGLPGFASSGSPGRVLEVWTLCAAVLAAVGVDALPRLTRRQGLLTLAAFALGLLLSGSYAAWWVARNYGWGTLQAGLAHVPDWWRLPVGILLGAGAFAALWRQGRWTARSFQVSITVLVLTDLLAANGSYNRTSRAQDVYPATPLIAFLQTHAEGARIMPLNRAWSLAQPPQAILPPNSATVYNLQDLQGYDSLLVGRYMTWAGALDSGSPAPPENGNMVFTYGLEAAQARAAGARWIVSAHPLPPNNDLRPAYAGPDGFVYEDTRAQTPANLVVQDAPTRAQVTISGGQAGPVTWAEQWYPGWWSRQAGGNWTRVGRADGIFQTIAVSGGPSAPTTVEVRYRPATVQVGLYALCVTLLGLSTLLGARLHRGSDR